jgi:hypothetical protein
MFLFQVYFDTISEFLNDKGMQSNYLMIGNSVNDVFSKYFCIFKSSGWGFTKLHTQILKIFCNFVT